jgi:hypothetical protein
MADGSFPSLVSKDRDINAATNAIYVTLTDQTDTALIDGSGNLQVILAANDGVDIGDVDVTSVIPGTGATNLGKAVDSVAGATDTGVLALAVRDDALTTLTPVDGDYVQLRTTSTGALWVTPTSSGDMSNVVADDSAFAVGTDTVGVVGMLADETTPDSVNEGDVGVPRMTLDRKQLIVLADATTDSQRLAIDSSGLAQVDVAAHALTNTNAVPVSKDNSANSETNPIFVKLTDTAVSGVEIHDYDTAAAVASDATDNHDYTVANTTFFLKSVIVAGSGNIKFEIQTGPVAGLSTVAVGFLTGRQGDTQQVFFDPAVEVPATSTGTVRVIRTNRQGAATDLYSTIIGNDV